MILLPCTHGRKEAFIGVWVGRETLVVGPGGGHAPEDPEGIAVSYFVKDEMVVFHLVTQPGRSGVSALKFGNVSRPLLPCRLRQCRPLQPPLGGHCLLRMSV